MSSSSSLVSVWDGYIIPHRYTASPIFEVCWSLKKQGFAERTIEAVGKKLRNISRYMVCIPSVSSARAAR